MTAPGQQAGGRRERYCEVCGADIRTRGARAKYCRSCARDVSSARGRALNRARREEGTADYAGLAAAEIAALKEKAAKEGPKPPAVSRGAGRKKKQPALKGWTLSECAAEAARRGLTYGQFVSLAEEGRIRPRKASK